MNLSLSQAHSYLILVSKVRVVEPLLNDEVNWRSYVKVLVHLREIRIQVGVL